VFQVKIVHNFYRSICKALEKRATETWFTS